MWDEFRAGGLPQPDLTNLDVLLELGGQIDHEAVEVAGIADYAAWWQRQIDGRHQFRPVPPSARVAATAAAARTAAPPSRRRAAPPPVAKRGPRVQSYGYAAPV